MSLEFNSSDTDLVLFNGTVLDKVNFNNETIYDNPSGAASETFNFTWYPPSGTSTVGYPKLVIGLAHTPTEITSVSVKNSLTSASVSVSNLTDLTWHRETNTQNGVSYTDSKTSLSGSSYTFDAISGGASAYAQTGTITINYIYGPCFIGYVSSGTSQFSSKWNSKTEDVMETGITSVIFTPSSSYSYSVNMAYFKVDLKKFKYLNISNITTGSVGVWLYSKTKETITSNPYESYITYTANSDLDLTDYDGKYIGIYVSSSSVTATVFLHN